MNLQVKDVQLFHQPKATGGLSKGCGFVYFEDKESAVAAISGMNEKTTLKVSDAFLSQQDAVKPACCSEAVSHTRCGLYRQRYGHAGTVLVRNTCGVTELSRQQWR